MGSRREQLKASPTLEAKTLFEALREHRPEAYEEGQWDRIFQDPMTTAAAIDRVVHHSVIVELTGRSIREEQAQARNGTTFRGGGQQVNFPADDGGGNIEWPAPADATPTISGAQHVDPAIDTAVAPSRATDLRGVARGTCQRV